MAVELSTALGGMAAAQERLRASANQLATASARLQPEAPALEKLGSGAQAELQARREAPDLARSLVEQRAAAYQFIANLRVLQTQLRMSGVVLDIYA